MRTIDLSPRATNKTTVGTNKASNERWRVTGNIMIQVRSNAGVNFLGTNMVTFKVVTGALQTPFPAPDGQNVRKVRVEINTDSNLKLDGQEAETFICAR